jgi:hypothetical protein
VFDCDLNHLKGLSPWVLSQLYPIPSRYHRRFFAIRTLLKTYHHGLFELFCISVIYHHGFYSDNNPLKGLSPWIVWDNQYCLRISPCVWLKQKLSLWFMQMRSYKNAWRRWLWELYCISIDFQRRFYCKKNPKKTYLLSLWEFSSFIVAIAVGLFSIIVGFVSFKDFNEVIIGC